MRKNFGAKPYLYPQPVLIVATYGEDGTPDAMNAARGAFTVSMADEAHVTECDYLGLVSANDVPDKLARAGFHTTKSELVDAPLIDELPLSLECRLLSYDPATGHLFGEIVNVSADERILNEAGKVDPEKLCPITFDPFNNAYLKLGEKVGNAFKDGSRLK